MNRAELKLILETMPNTLFLDKMKNSWTANVELNNGQVITIWHTCWPSIKHQVKNIIDISSDYPRHKIITT